MKFSLVHLIVNLLAVHAVDTSLRGSESLNEGTQQLQCSIAGAGGEDACEGAADESGDPCVWCMINTFGLCVSDDQADQMKKNLPMITCSNDDTDDDDDDAPEDDDEAPAADDDESPEGDDDTPADYWTCLKDSGNEADCGTAGCSWCMTGAGYGLCFDKEAAEQANKSDWFDCEGTAKPLRDPYDMTCIIQSAGGDADACESSEDADGQPCEWCSLQSHDFCASADQAQIFEQLGATCDDRDALSSPSDPSCLAQSTEDEETCESTMDEDGNACHACTYQNFNVCLTGDQADIAKQLGADCDDKKTVESGDNLEVSIATA